MMPDQASRNAWVTTAIIPDLGGEDLYVFRVNLPIHEQLKQQYYGLLTEPERDRVARFKHELARSHALVGRGVLRSLLGRFLDIAPRAVPIQSGPQGKPEVDGVSFNLAHSGQIILLAFSRTGLLGLDIERVDSRTPILDIAERYFSPREIAQISAGSSDSERRTAFFRQWSRKEAIIKADGRGLSVELSSFSAEDSTTISGVTGDAQSFRVHSLTIGKEYAAALATSELAAEPRLLTIPDEMNPNDYLR